MKKQFLTASIFALGLLAISPANACPLYRPFDINNVRHADVVATGTIEDYEIILDQRQRYPAYARFNLNVEKIFKGKVPSKVTVTWQNSIFGEPEDYPAGPFLIALVNPSLGNPLHGPSTSKYPTPEAYSYSVLQQPCSGPFILDASDKVISTVKQVLGGMIFTEQPTGLFRNAEEPLVEKLKGYWMPLAGALGVLLFLGFLSSKLVQSKRAKNS